MTSPRTDILLKTWWNDLAFCSYALHFLEKNWVEPNSNIIVLADNNCYPVIKDWGFSERVKYYYVAPWPDGNQFQVYLTFLADHFSDADLICVMDSDCMLLEPMRASDKMVEGKPILCYEPLEDMVKNPGRTLAANLWFPIMEHWLGERPQADYMSRFPFIYWTDTIRAVRRLVTNKTRIGFLEALYSDAPFKPETFVQHPFKMCEHNVLGFYAQLHEPERYHFQPVSKQEWPVHQYHSWTQWSLETQAQLDKLLGR
jgi:hypothetical protein